MAANENESDVPCEIMRIILGLVLRGGGGGYLEETMVGICQILYSSW